MTSPALAPENTSTPERRTPRRPSPLLWIVLGALVVLGTLLGLFAATTTDPAGALSRLVTGPLSSPGRVRQWLAYSSYLALAGLAVALVFRVGQFAIGAEGQIVVGALSAGIVVLSVPAGPAAVALGLLAAVAGGFLWGAVPGLMKAYLGTDEIISTLMLNYVALFGFAFAVKEFLAPPGAGFPVSAYFDRASWLPPLGGTGGLPAAALIAVLVALAAWVLLQHSPVGLHLRMVGDSPSFARALGLPVPLLIWLSMALSGAVAGLAGGVIATGDTHRLILGISANLGFDGILVALLALNRPLLVPLSALAYGYLRTGGDVLQLTDGVPREVITVVQGLLVLVLAVLVRRRAQSSRSKTPRVKTSRSRATGPRPGSTGHTPTTKEA